MAECPFCKENVGANDFLPSKEATCSVCGKRPLAPAPSEPWWDSLASPAPLEPKAVRPGPSPKMRWMAPGTAEQNGPVRTPRTSPKSNKPETGPVGADSPPLWDAPSNSLFPPYDVSEDDDEPTSLLDRVRAIDLGTALAFLCFSMALLFGSFEKLELFLKPIAALGLLAGLLLGALPVLGRGKNAALPLLMSLLCFLVFLFAGRWPRWSSSPPPLVAVALKQKGMAAHQAVGDNDWVDASANAVKRDDVRVEIVSVQIGPVDLNRKPTAAPSTERYLTIRLLVSYEGVLFRQTPYGPWADLAGSPSKHAPTLTDDQDRTYAQKTFDPGWKVVGRADADALNPGHQVKEVLVFPIPASDMEHLRLMLPASAFGLSGAFRFQIPRSMIRGL